MAPFMQHLQTPAEIRRQGSRIERSLGRLTTTIEKRKAALADERRLLEDKKLKAIGEPWWNK